MSSIRPQVVHINLNWNAVYEKQYQVQSNQMNTIKISFCRFVTMALGQDYYALLLDYVKKRRRRVVTTPVSYSVGSGFKPSTRRSANLTHFFFTFLSPCRKKTERYLKSYHDRPLHIPSKSLFIYHTNIQSHIVWATDSTVKWTTSNANNNNNV
jgi:hypothetical protein